MLTATAKVSNNFIGTGCLIPVTVILNFLGIMRVVLPAEIRTYESSECIKAYTDIQALLIKERHAKSWIVENVISLSKSSNVIAVKVYNLRVDCCKIQRYPQYAIGETLFTYDLAVFYLTDQCYRIYQIKEKDLSTLLLCKLDHVPPPEARLISSCRAEVLDLLAPDSISLSIYD
ncbi:MAG: hypothetical protein VB084_04350 [Syntrophomonadaceae bacterium]|nr:hypothetical protein [Syntrophomonadaceae bacterium]